eukprot:Partr_v1_DN23781_c0_g1_i4_m52801 putative Yippee-like
MGLIYREFLSGKCIIECQRCSTHLSVAEDIISKQFHGNFGQAYLMNAVINIYEGPGQDRQMATGLHLVHTIYCKTCENILGWRYEKAYDSTQKYKEGKYVLEATHIRPGFI